MSSFFLSSPASAVTDRSRYTPSPARRALMTRQDVSPLQSRQDRIDRWRDNMKTKRQQSIMDSRGGMDNMSASYLKAHYENSLKELQRQAEVYAARYEDEEEFFEDNDYCHGRESSQGTPETPAQTARIVRDEADLLDEILLAEEEEIRYLTEQMTLREKEEEFSSSDWDIDLEEIERWKSQEEEKAEDNLEQRFSLEHSMEDIGDLNAVMKDMKR